MTRGAFFRLLAGVSFIGLLRSQSKYEWVVGPIKTQPSQRSVMKYSDERIVMVSEGPFTCVVYGQVRRLFDGKILSWAKEIKPDVNIKKVIGNYPNAIDWGYVLHKTDQIAFWKIPNGFSLFEVGLIQ